MTCAQVGRIAGSDHREGRACNTGLFIFRQRGSRRESHGTSEAIMDTQSLLEDGGNSMDSKPPDKQPKLENILKGLEAKHFHGNITVHYTNGQPRKIEYKTVEDLNK